MKHGLVAIGIVQVLLGASSSALTARNPPCLTEAQGRERIAEILHDHQPTLWKCSSDATAVISDTRPGSHTVAEIATALNQRFESAKLPTVRILRTDQDTVVLTVSDPAQLTQRMGTTGARCYLAEVTFSLTSIDGVDYIWLDVPEGDHAEPGRFGRASFPDLFPLTDDDTRK